MRDHEEVCVDKDWTLHPFRGQIYEGQPANERRDA